MPLCVRQLARSEETADTFIEATEHHFAIKNIIVGVPVELSKELFAMECQSRC